MRCTRLPAALALVVLSGAWAVPAEAGKDEWTEPQAVAPTDAQTSALEDLRRLIEDQRILIERQADRLTALERDLKETKSQLATIAEKQGVVLPAVEERLAAIEQSAQRQPELPTDVQADFPPSGFQAPTPSSRSADRPG
jgi:septal ring factor EnvC (AmiA/AmiB activator)